MTLREIGNFDFSDPAWAEICRTLQATADDLSLRFRLRLAAWNYLAAVQLDRQTLPKRHERWNGIAKTSRALSEMLSDADAVIVGPDEYSALQASLRHLQARAAMVDDVILETLADPNFDAPLDQAHEPRRNLVKASLDVFVELRRARPTANKPKAGDRYTGDGYAYLRTITEEVMGDSAPAPDTVVRWVKQYASQASEI